MKPSRAIVLARIRDAAARGAPAPSLAELAQAAGGISRMTARNIVNELAVAGHITGHGTRRALAYEVVATGQRTAPVGPRTPAEEARRRREAVLAAITEAADAQRPPPSLSALAQLIGTGRTMAHRVLAALILEDEIRCVGEGHRRRYVVTATGRATATGSMHPPPDSAPPKPLAKRRERPKPKPLPVPDPGGYFGALLRRVREAGAEAIPTAGGFFAAGSLMSPSEFALWAERQR